MNQKTETVQRVALANIVDSPFQKRTVYDESQDWPDFLASIRASGVTQPCIGRQRGKTIELVNGHRRKRASAELKLPDLPVIVRELTDEQVRELLAIENLQRENLSPLDEAAEYADWRDSLLKAGTVKTVDEAVAHICAKVGRQRSTVYDTLKLLKTTPKTQAALRGGKLDASKAKLLASIPDPALQDKCLKEITDPDWDYTGNPMSVREAQDHIERKYQKSLKNAPFDLNTDYAMPKGGIAGVTMTPQLKFLRCMDCPQRQDKKCLNPKCFEAKKMAATAAAAESARAKGKQVLTEKEYAKNKGKFVAADDYCKATTGYYDTWRVAVGKHAPVETLVLTGDGLKTVYVKEEAMAAAKKNGKKFKAAQRRGPSPAEKQQQALREPRLKMQEQLLPVIVQKLMKGLTEGNTWLFFFKNHGDCSYGVERLLKKLGFPALAKCTAQQMRVLAIAQASGLDYEVEWLVDGDGSYNEQGEALCKLAGIDLAAEEKKALAAAQAAVVDEKLLKHLTAGTYTDVVFETALKTANETTLRAAFGHKGGLHPNAWSLINTRLKQLAKKRGAEKVLGGAPETTRGARVLPKMSAAKRAKIAAAAKARWAKIKAKA